MKNICFLSVSIIIILKYVYGTKDALINFRDPVHSYQNKPPQDPFSKFFKNLENGNITLNFNSEKEYLLSLFKELEISPYSQLLVYSTTSLQLSRISPSNPRAIYFGDDIYLGYVPGGQIEIIGIDPELGAIPYIFNIPRKNDLKHPSIYRSKRCMNCHASQETKGAPGLLLSSVIPGPGGGSIDAFRRGEFGHAVSYEKRFGGWHITGMNPFTNSWANHTGIMQDGEIKKINNPPGKYFSWDKYPIGQSDALPHLVLEHQVGFTNLCISISYKFREIKSLDEQPKSEEYKEIIENETNSLLFYVLFKNEAKLPRNKMRIDSPFAKDFKNSVKPTNQAMLLREFDLEDRIFQLRCSYMIFSNSFEGLPVQIKNQFLKKLRYILSCERKNLPKEYSYLDCEERHKINSILLDSLSGYSPKKKASIDAF
ncbi:MAG: hypothetical protein HN548_11450 [Opitutae bacterium]|nr:hypothetical protein [Opitutae bacterium]